MAVFMLEDRRAASRWWSSPRRSRKYPAFIENGAMLLVRGKFERDEESSRFVATEILPLSALKERLSRGVRIRLKAAARRRRSGRSRK